MTPIAHSVNTRVVSEPAVPGAQHARPLRVSLAGRLTAFAAPGGGEVQMLALLPELHRLGVAADAWQPWVNGFDGLDVLHLFGSAPEFLEVASAARRRGVRVVLSPIAWFDLRSVWGEPRHLAPRLAASSRYLLRRAVPALPTWRRRLYHAVDLVLPNSQAEAQQLRTQFGVTHERIRVVPNAASGQFADGDARPFADLVGGPGFALCVGRIEPRKNQLQLLRALHGSGVRVVIVGNPTSDHAAYFAACKQAADEHARFVPRLAHEDPLLASAYAACGCLVQPSWFETPGLAALEAGLAGAPLVVSRFGCTHEYFAEHARYVHPGRAAELRAAVTAAVQQPRQPALARHIQAHFTWQAAASATARAYASIR